MGKVHLKRWQTEGRGYFLGQEGTSQFILRGGSMGNACEEKRVEAVGEGRRWMDLRYSLEVNQPDH